MKYLAQQAINALQLGSIYALIALGYSMVYGVLTMINFAHGDVFMLGSFFCLLLIAFVPVPFWLALIVVMGATALLGTFIERFAYRPLRNAPRVSAIITALGCGLVIQNTTLGISPYARPMPHLINNVTYQFGGLTVTTLQMVIIGISVGLMMALDFLIGKTSFGMAMRAISSDRATVPLLGIPANRVIAITFALGAALGGAAGLLYGMAYPVVSAAMGITVGWKAFIAAVIGGIGNMRGAVLGAFLLGAVEIMSVALDGVNVLGLFVIHLPSTYRDLICYSLLLLILVFKPHGLLGKPTLQKA